MEIYSQDETDKLSSILKNDGVICVPTDTVYGLCARTNSVKAYRKLSFIKNRPLNKNFPVMCANIEQIKEIAIVNEKILKLIHAFMPGAVTLVLNKKTNSFTDINNGGVRNTSEIAVRLAPSKKLKELINKVGSPIFMTSANKSGKEECKTLQEIEKEFPNLDGIMDGKVQFGTASTIIDCTQEKIKIQREGPISSEQIRIVLDS